MDHDSTFADAKEAIRQFCAERQWDSRHGAKDLAIGLVTEACELLEIFRFATESEVDQLLKNNDTRAHIADELADSLYFVLRFAERFDFDLSQGLRDKAVKNAAKYPVGAPKYPVGEPKYPVEVPKYPVEAEEYPAGVPKLPVD